MSVKWKTKTNRLPEIAKTLEGLNGKKVKVGAFNGDHAWLAGIHEHGAHIKAKKSKYLTVPVCPEAAGKKASDFSNLFVYTSKEGNKMLARNEGGELKFYYWLTPSVEIPERAFLKNGHDANAERVLRQTERMLSRVIAGEKTIDDVLNAYGQQMATAIKLYMRDLTNPSNNPITVENKGDDNPLIGKTKGLHNSIDFKVEG